MNKMIDGNHIAPYNNFRSARKRSRNKVQRRMIFAAILQSITRFLSLRYAPLKIKQENAYARKRTGITVI